MLTRWFGRPKALLFVVIIALLTFGVACGAAAPEEVAPVAEPASAPEVAPAQPEPQAESTGSDSSMPAEPAPTAEAAPAKESMAEPMVVRIIESQGEITQETNQHCAGGRPITSNFNPYAEHPLDINPVTAEVEAWLAESWESSADSRS